VPPGLIGREFLEGPHATRVAARVSRPGASFPLLINAPHMYRAFTGALALALTILVLHWTFPELADVLVDDMLKALLLVGRLLDIAAAMVDTDVTTDVSLSS
jgi:hypothetical protein